MGFATYIEDLDSETASAMVLISTEFDRLSSEEMKKARKRG